MGVYLERLDVSPTHPEVIGAGSRTDKKLTGLTVPKKISQERIEYPAIACDQSISVRYGSLGSGRK